MKFFTTLFVVCFMSVLSSFAQHPDPNWASVKIPQLIITEANLIWQQEYVELTNVGDVGIDLSNFALSNLINVSATKYDPLTRYLGSRNLDKRFTYYFKKGEILGPGKSVLIMRVEDLDNGTAGQTRHLEKLVPKATHFSHYQGELETDLFKFVNKPQYQAYDFDSINSVSALFAFSPNPMVLSYRYQRPYYDKALDITYMVKDSLIADCFDMAVNAQKAFNAPTAVAGIPNVNTSRAYHVVRKADVKHGNANWDLSRGISAEDSEWMLVDCMTGREPFTSAANHGDFTITVTAKWGTSIGSTEITVPWEILRGDDLILNALRLGKGMAWKYINSPVKSDSASLRITERDAVILYAFGNKLSSKKYTFKVKEAEANLAIAYPRIVKDAKTGFYPKTAWLSISNDNQSMDTIANAAYQTPVDSLLKYIDIPPLASREIIFKDGDKKRVEVMDGDVLRVKSEDKTTTKDYYIKVNKYKKNTDASLSVISFPDYSLDDYYWDWASLRLDTIPDFSPAGYSYTIKVSPDRKTIPALVAITGSRNARIKQTPATNLDGSLAERTTKFEVTSESGTTTKTYTVTFVREVSDSEIQPITGDAFVSEIAVGIEYGDHYLELYNPTSKDMDMSDYYWINLHWWATPEAALSWGFNLDAAGLPDLDALRRSILPGREFDIEKWKTGKACFFKLVPGVNTIVKPGDVFVTGVCSPAGKNEMAVIKEVDQNVFDPRPSAVWANGPGAFSSNGWALLKLLNDSIKNGLKPISKIKVKDYKLVDLFRLSQADIVKGAPFNVGGLSWTGRGHDFIRKSRVKKGVLKQGEGTSYDPVACDWTRRSLWIVPGINEKIARDNIGRHNMDPITVQYSTITSSVYKVTPGYVGDLKVIGIPSGTAVTDFILNVNKADPAQVLVVSNGGAVKGLTDAVIKGDILTVTSGDLSNKTIYTLEPGALNGDVSLTAVAGLKVTVTNNKIGGFGYDAIIADVLAGVSCHKLSYINIINSLGNIVPLHTIRYTQALDKEENMVVETVDSKVFDGLIFEVVAQNGDRKKYAIAPETKDLYITSNYFNVIKEKTDIYGIPEGLSVTAFLSYLTSTNNGTIQVFNKAHYVRTEGYLKTDDYVKVTSADGKMSVVYSLYFVGEEVANKIINSVQKPVLAGSMSKIYPNPVDQVLTVEDAPVGSVIQIISISGIQVYTQLVSALNFTIPVSQLDRGLYIVRIVEKEGASIHKMIKR
ncbi:MAG: T9SS type A sorting domain-containing protein [Prolixibacteraceae bacterium]|nr:T9SS type A sorting domain-containing protein [Prolixibacteraceae bacterium]